MSSAVLQLSWQGHDTLFVTEKNSIGIYKFATSATEQSTKGSDSANSGPSGEASVEHADFMLHDSHSPENCGFLKFLVEDAGPFKTASASNDGKLLAYGFADGVFSV